MKHQPDRTCIGCRSIVKKSDAVRIVAIPDGIVIDYREKLAGRAAYVCPKKECIKSAFDRDNLSRALHVKMPRTDPEVFTAQLRNSIAEKIRSLISIAFKAGKLAAGYSAAADACEKDRVELLLFATDLSEGTESKIEQGIRKNIRTETCFTRDELGSLLNRELVGVLGVLEKGLADAIGSELQRLKNLINNSH